MKRAEFRRVVRAEFQKVGSQVEDQEIRAIVEEFLKKNSNPTEVGRVTASIFLAACSSLKISGSEFRLKNPSSEDWACLSDLVYRVPWSNSTRRSAAATIQEYFTGNKSWELSIPWRFPFVLRIARMLRLPSDFYTWFLREGVNHWVKYKGLLAQNVFDAFQSAGWWPRAPKKEFRRFGTLILDVWLKAGQWSPADVHDLCLLLIRNDNSQFGDTRNADLDRCFRALLESRHEMAAFAVCDVALHMRNWRLPPSGGLTRLVRRAKARLLLRTR